MFNQLQVTEGCGHCLRRQRQQAAHECERVICCLLIRTQAGRLGWGRLGLVWGRILCIRTSPCLAAALRNSRPVLAVVTSSTVTVTVTAGGAHSSSSSSLWLLSTKLGWLLLLSLLVQNVDFLLICSAFVVAVFFSQFCGNFNWCLPDWRLAARALVAAAVAAVAPICHA